MSDRRGNDLELLESLESARDAAALEQAIAEDNGERATAAGLRKELFGWSLCSRSLDSGPGTGSGCDAVRNRTVQATAELTA